MIKTIKIGNKEIEMKSNALTPVLYTNYFKSDMMAEMLRIQKQMESTTNPDDIMNGVDTQTFFKVAFIMSGASKQHIDYFDWLEQFEMIDMYEALPDIMEVWMGNTGSVVEDITPKKAEAVAVD